MWPLLLRPEPRFWLSTSEAIGGPLCRLALTTLTSERRPLDVGLTLTSAISGLRREVDFLARLPAHVGLLPFPAPANMRAEALLRALFGHDRREQHGHQSLGVVFDGRIHAMSSSNCVTAPLVSST